MVKAEQKEHLNIKEAMYETTIVNITSSYRMEKCFYISMQMGQGVKLPHSNSVQCLISQLVNKARKGNKSDPRSEKPRIDDTILYLKYLKDCAIKQLGLINFVAMEQDYKNQQQQK